VAALASLCCGLQAAKLSAAISRSAALVSKNPPRRIASKGRARSDCEAGACLMMDD